MFELALKLDILPRGGSSRRATRGYITSHLVRQFCVLHCALCIEKTPSTEGVFSQLLSELLHINAASRLSTITAASPAAQEVSPPDSAPKKPLSETACLTPFAIV